MYLQKPQQFIYLFILSFKVDKYYKIYICNKEIAVAKFCHANLRQLPI